MSSTSVQSVSGPRFRGGLGDEPSRALIAYTVERAIARARQVSTRRYRRPAEGEVVWLRPRLLAELKPGHLPMCGHQEA